MTTHVPMQYLWPPTDEHASLKCACGKVFDVDAITQKNMTIERGYQIEQCPDCNCIRDNVPAGCLAVWDDEIL